MKMEVGVDIIKILFIHTFYTYMNFIYTRKFQRINKINFKKFQNLHNVYTCDILKGLKIIFLTKNAQIFPFIFF